MGKNKEKKTKPRPSGNQEKNMSGKKYAAPGSGWKSDNS